MGMTVGGGCDCKWWVWPLVVGVAVSGGCGC